MNKVLQLGERAEKALNFWGADSMWYRLIKRDMDANDAEALEFHLKEAESEQAFIEDAKEFSRRWEAYLLGEEKEMPGFVKDLPEVPRVEL